MQETMDWDVVVGDIAPRLYRYFCARFDQIQADDLTQETLIRLVRKVKDGKFDPKRGNLRMLAFGIAHYITLEAQPDTKLESLEVIETERLPYDPSDDAETLLITKDQASQVRDALKSLSQIEQEIIALSIDEELGSSEIAQLLQIPHGTIKSHIFRAKKKITNIINQENST